jgi:tetratricopeptide (TPR) repeat protein
MEPLAHSRPLFGGETAPEVSELLARAMQSYADTQLAETLLWQAHSKAPDALPVYYSLYKFYFYKRDLENAELTARMALQAAARAGGFDADMMALHSDSADWEDYANPAHFYLFSLKALAFILLRRGVSEEATLIVDKLIELDPHDSVGASVVRSIAEGSH